MKTHIYYIAVIVSLLALGFWGRQANRATLAMRESRIAVLQSELAGCRAEAKARDAALAGLRAQNNAAQENCAAALAAMSLASEISRLTPSNPRHADGTAHASPAVPSVNTGAGGAQVQDDAVFTEFLNAF